MLFAQLKIDAHRVVFEQYTLIEYSFKKIDIFDLVQYLYVAPLFNFSSFFSSR